MKALILAGGLGTRLQPLTRNLPKPMVPVVNRPIVEHTILLLKKHKITEIIFLLYYLPDLIKNHFKDGSEFGVKVEYLTANTDYATAGAVRLAAEKIDDVFLVVSGDGMTDLDISRFIKFHQEKRALASLALSSVPNPSPFGIAVTDEEQRITRFLEKPGAGQIFSHKVNMGIYILEPEIFNWIPENAEYYFAKHLFPELVENGERIYGFTDNCYWIDVGNFESYQQAHRDFFNKKIQLNTKEELKNGIWQGENCEIGTGVKIEGCVVLGDHCRIGDQVALNNSVIGKNCRIDKNSYLVNTILWDKVEVGKNCKLVYDVVDRGIKISDGTVIQENEFVSDS